MTRICPDCGEDFETTNLGPATAVYCPKCAGERIRREEEQERLAAKAFEESRYREIVTLAQIPPKWRETSFENSDATLNAVAFKVARRYAENFPGNSQSLIFYSAGPGTGKTHLAVCIANFILHRRRMPVLFKKARDLMLELRRSFADGAEVTEADILDRVLSAKLLVLDDVGVDRHTAWQESTYWTVFDRRLDWELPVVITTNKPLEPGPREEGLAERIGDRAVSRLIEFCQGNVIDMSGPDLR